MKAVVLVTGASRGIGREIARQFALDGYRVAVNYHEHAAAAESLVQELKAAGCDVLAIKADVGDRSQVDAMTATIRRSFGPIGILINNAGIAQQKLFADISEAEWDRMFTINVKGVFHCCQSVLPDMIHKKAGKIINISSVWGLTGASCEVAYSAAKAAVIGFTKALAKELGQSGIQVNCVAPGVIDTDMNAELDDETRQNLKDQTPLGVIGSTSDIAHTVLFLASEQSAFITGQVISPNGGFLI
ncbi:MAG: SDR family oxidoreductase [Clostridiaceae bacterium]|nr:SDR family oxidoreductase [Clostridiaceae bacterium]